jgi:hypothetical protein
MSEDALSTEDDINSNLDNRKKGFETYFFHYFDKNRGRFAPSFGHHFSYKNKLNNAKKDPSFFEVELYKISEKIIYDEDYLESKIREDSLKSYFNDVFEDSSVQNGKISSHKYYNVILPKQKYDEIKKSIDKFKLLDINDLLFEIISIAQNMYVKDIHKWEKAEMKRLVSTAEAETRNAINLLETYDTDDWELRPNSNRKPPELQNINFVFDDLSIKIKHKWLAKEFIEHFKNHYNNLPNKNWRIDLALYPNRFKSNIRKQNFKYHLAYSFYNLFTKGGFFSISETEPTPNQLMLCIAKMLEFCLIQVVDFEDSDDIKIKNIRNWLKRNKQEPAITFAEIPLDKTRLLKYFEPDFISLSADVKRADAIQIGLFVAKRFKIEKLTADLIHITQALKAQRDIMRLNMLDNEIPFKDTFDEFESFKKLVNGTQSNQKMTSIKFKLEGDDKEYELNQRLPIHFLEEAIISYSKDNHVEMNSDLTTSINKDTKTLDLENKFIQPNQRFVVLFVKAFYKYLSTEVSNLENHELSSTESYEIIAIILKKTIFPENQLMSDDFTIAKVKQWHVL